MGTWETIEEFWDSLWGDAEKAEEDAEYFTETEVGDSAQECPLKEKKTLVLIPRKPENTLDAERYVPPLLPDRYPPKNLPIKNIEYNFYPDLNITRTITAVVTEKPWSPQCDQRPNPRQGVTVYFSLGNTTADVTLSAEQDTTDVEGCASVQVTVNKLYRTKTDIEKANRIEIRASMSPMSHPEDETLILTIHRNEDVHKALDPNERPGKFATTLHPVLRLQTWLVRQINKEEWVNSNGVKAVQQLLNQVACRKKTGKREFIRPGGNYGPRTMKELERFISDFGTKPTDSAANDYSSCRFGVEVEEPKPNIQGVKTYVRKEYGKYEDGLLVDAHLLVGKVVWSPSASIKVMDADGLLDIYTAVVWEFIEAAKDRAEDYVTEKITWYRNPNDTGVKKKKEWPKEVTRGVAYSFGSARSLKEFLNDLNPVDPKPDLDKLPDYYPWMRYKPFNNCRIGIHGAGDKIDIPKEVYMAYDHLQNDSGITAKNSTTWVLHHKFKKKYRKQYTGIDCSAFVQRVATEACFRSDACNDLAGQKICLQVPEIKYEDGFPEERLSTVLWYGKRKKKVWVGEKELHYRRMRGKKWLKEVVFSGDLLNIPGAHIVLLDVADRKKLTQKKPKPGDIQIAHANGGTKVYKASRKGGFTTKECPRRCIRSPLAQWPSGWKTWRNKNNKTHFGRIYLWD